MKVKKFPGCSSFIKCSRGLKFNIQFCWFLFRLLVEWIITTRYHGVYATFHVVLYLPQLRLAKSRLRRLITAWRLRAHKRVSAQCTEHSKCCSNHCFSPFFVLFHLHFSVFRRWWRSFVRSPFFNLLLLCFLFSRCQNMSAVVVEHIEPESNADCCTDCTEDCSHFFLLSLVWFV